MVVVEKDAKCNIKPGKNLPIYTDNKKHIAKSAERLPTCLKERIGNTMIDRTSVLVSWFNYKTGKLMRLTDTHFFKDIDNFDDLPDICKTDEVKKDFDKWLNQRS